MSRGAAMPVRGAAGIMLAEARAAVRNSASRRVIDPVICVLKMRPLALEQIRRGLRALTETTIKRHKPARLLGEMLPPWVTIYQAIAVPSKGSRGRLLCLALLLFAAALGS